MHLLDHGTGAWDTAQVEEDCQQVRSRREDTGGFVVIFVSFPQSVQSSNRSLVPFLYDIKLSDLLGIIVVA